MPVEDYTKEILYHCTYWKCRHFIYNHQGYLKIMHNIINQSSLNIAYLVIFVTMCIC